MVACAVGRPVEVHAYADRIVIRQDRLIVAEHRRSFGRGETTYEPWHYVPVLARKPGALRNGAPFKDWVLPAAMERIQRRLAGAGDGNRPMVDILTAVLTDGCRRSRRPVPRRLRGACIPPTSSSTFWPASAIPDRQPRSSRRQRRRFATPRR